MRKAGTTRMTVKPGETPPRGDTDWARVRAMTDDEVLAAALSDPDAQPLSPEELKRMRRAPPKSSVSTLLSSWTPLDEEFPEIDNLEPIEDVEL
jgi:hypothetical protein